MIRLAARDKEIGSKEQALKEWRLHYNAKGDSPPVPPAPAWGLIPQYAFVVFGVVLIGSFAGGVILGSGYIGD